MLFHIFAHKHRKFARKMRHLTFVLVLELENVSQLFWDTLYLLRSTAQVSTGHMTLTPGPGTSVTWSLVTTILPLISAKYNIMCPVPIVSAFIILCMQNASYNIYLMQNMKDENLVKRSLFQWYSIYLAIKNILRSFFMQIEKFSNFS